MFINAIFWPQNVSPSGEIEDCYIKGTGMLVGKIGIKPLKETNIGVARASLTPRRYNFLTQTTKSYSDF